MNIDHINTLTVMRTSIIIACLILCGCVDSINAQWYTRKYGVENINDLSDEQLRVSYSIARTSAILGGVVTGTGIVLTISGVVTSANYVWNDFLNYPSGAPTTQPDGSGLFISGALLAVGGAVLWISAGSRKKQTGPIIKSRGLVSNISVYPGAGYEFLTDTYYPAVTIRIGF